MTGLDHAQAGIGAQGWAARKASTVRWRIFGIVFVLVVINLIDRVTLSIAMPTISKEFSLEPAMQGIILSAFFWSYALLQIPGGWLIDRFGPRALITGATVGWGFFKRSPASLQGAFRYWSAALVSVLPRRRSFRPARSSIRYGCRRESAHGVRCW